MMKETKIKRWILIYIHVSIPLEYITLQKPSFDQVDNNVLINYIVLPKTKDDVDNTTMNTRSL